MCLTGLGLGMNAEDWGAEVEGVVLRSPCCCLEARETLSLLKLDQGYINLWTGAMPGPK